jgi:glycosyltransferase involved in cell wall biosynthesis
VATEAQFSGIPVIATNDGGLPESVGDGGILVERNANIVEWHNALRELWDDKEKYRMYSNRARIWSQRKEINPEILANKVLNVCTDAIDAHRSGYTQWR